MQTLLDVAGAGGHNTSILFAFAGCVIREEDSFDGLDKNVPCFGTAFMLLHCTKPILKDITIVLRPGSPEALKFRNFVIAKARMCKQHQFAMHLLLQIHAKVVQIVCDACASLYWLMHMPMNLNTARRAARRTSSRCSEWPAFSSTCIWWTSASTT